MACLTCASLVLCIWEAVCVPVYTQSYTIFMVFKVGDQYAAENEDELKDKIDFEETAGYRLVTGKFAL